MSILHVMVGLPGSGKTTRAKAIALQTGALRLSPDDWHLRLFGQDLHLPDHDARHEAIEGLMRELAFDLLRRGLDVIVDFGLWTRAERDALRAEVTAFGASMVLHPCDAPLVALFARIQTRTGGFAVTMQMLQDWHAVYEPVTPQEAAL
jgi:predicted kinase